MRRRAASVEFRSGGTRTAVSSAGSPVLIGRDELLALGERRAAAVAIGRDGGHLLFLAGEAGIGKTRLVGAILRRAERLGMRGISAAAFPRDLEASGALLLDLADRLRRSSEQEWPIHGERLRHQLEPVEPGGDEADRRRRQVVLDIVETLTGLAASGPVALALEDLHWADDLTLEVVARLARRLPDVPILVVGSYRSDELYPRVPMRQWRSRLLGQRLAEEAVVPRLGLDETRDLARFLVGGPLPPSGDLVALLHQRSDGIPLHIEELLAAVARGSEAPTETLLLPGTLAEAVAARAGALSPLARRVAEAAAVIGRSFDLDLLAAVHLEASASSVSRAVAELQGRFFVVELRRDWFDVRHALIRDALEAAIDPARRRLLHARVAEAASGRPHIGSDAFLSAHFELAGMTDRAFHHARLGAARAASISAHRESLDLYRRAARTAPSTLPERERAALLRSLAAEQVATDDNSAAVESLTEAHALLVRIGDPIAAAELVPSLVAAMHLLGHDLGARVERIRAELDALGDAPAATRARLLAALSAAFMLDRRLDEAIQHGEAARDLAGREGDVVTGLHVETTLGSCLLFAGQMDAGWDMLERTIATARELRREGEAARGYRMIGSSASVLVAYERAERWLREGIDYAERTEQWNHRHYMAAHLGHVAWARGDWERASALAEHALSDGRGGLTTRITSLHVLGYLALGRGETERAVGLLSEAREHGERMRELQRFSPALWGLAESALLSGDPAEAVALSEAARAASMSVRDAAYLFPFLVTGTRAHLAAGDPHAAERWVTDVARAIEDRGIPGTLPAVDHARGLLSTAAGATGQARVQLATARDEWLRLGRWWEGQWAGVDLALCHLRSNRPRDAIGLLEGIAAAARAIGAVPLLSAAEELMRRARARHPADEPWAPLSAREFEVARLIAEGMTNRQIAEALTISPKTVSAHIEHILARLGVSRRSEIAAWTARVIR